MSIVDSILERLGLGDRKIVYGTENLAELQTSLLADIESGRLRTRRVERTTSTHRQVDVRAVNADVVYEVDYPCHMSGTFSYLYVQGRELIDDCDWDGRRVARAMATGTDPGPVGRPSGLTWL